MLYFLCVTLRGLFLKNMSTAVKIFLFLLLLSGTGAFLHGAGEPAVTFRFQEGVPLRSGEILRRFETFLKEVFPKRSHSLRPLTIYIMRPGGKKLEEKVEHLFEADFYLLEKQDLELLGRAGSAILRARGRVSDNYELPLFLCGAFRHRERAASRECRFLGNNRRFKSAEALLRAGRIPDLKRVLTFIPDPRDPIENSWFDDHSRLLWDLVRRKGFKNAPEELGKILAGVTARPLTFDDLAPLVWGPFNLFPPEWTQKHLESMLEMQIPKLDHNNEVTSLTETITADQFPVKLLKHPQRKAICTAFATSLLQQGERLPVFFRSDLRRLHEEIRRLGQDPEAGRGIPAALARLRRTLELYQARSGYLDSLESKEAQVMVRYRQSALANAERGTLITPESARFLQRAEEYYSGL